MTGQSWPLAGMRRRRVRALKISRPSGFGRLAGIPPVKGDSGSDGAPDLPLNQAEGEQARQITMTRAWMRRLDCTNRGATASEPLKAP
jgi:hypothetical protein